MAGFISRVRVGVLTDYCTSWAREWTGGLFLGLHYYSKAYAIPPTLDKELLKPGKDFTHQKVPFNIKVLSVLQNCKPVQRITPSAIKYKGMLKKIILLK